jgi:hypothetical protein
MTHRDTSSDFQAAEKVPDGVGEDELTIWSSVEKASGVDDESAVLTLDEVMVIHCNQIERYGARLGSVMPRAWSQLLRRFNLGLAVSIFTAISLRWHRPISFMWCRTIRY